MRPPPRHGESLDTSPVPAWLRVALFATAAMNILVGVAFASVGIVPGADAMLAAAGLPATAHPFYTMTVAMFVLLFGVGYLCAALAGHPERLFLALSGAGKVSFFALLVWLYARGTVPVRAPIAATPDLLFGALFLAWLVASRPAHGAGR